LFQNIKLIAFDFDGVFTNNKVFVDQSGNESVSCCRSDGIGLEMLRQLGIQSFVVSTEENQVVSQRCSKLKIECFQGVENKKHIFEKLCLEKQINLDDTAFVGNDINDIEVLGICGLPIAVADAYPEILSIAKYVTSKSGGCGAVREVCELINYSKSTLPKY
jgi:3-deoxy-D-manno-octulosonate 8-phosphate phosphatase (KDO 8-P phosphatase)